MKITKLVHSCLFVEEAGKSILIDPGIYSTKNVVTLDTFSSLDFLLITHEHADHMDQEFIKKLVEKFPQLEIISNHSVKTILGKNNIAVSTQGNDFIEVTEVPHENTPWFTSPPKNVLFTLFGKLTHPGDSLHLTNSSEILALPIQASWGSMAWAFETAVKLKPKIIIPIHDWQWRDEAREQNYKVGTEFFSKCGIDFKPVEQGLAWQD